MKRMINVKLSVDEAVMLNDAMKRRGFTSKAKLLKFLISELYKNEELNEEFKNFILKSDLSTDNTVTQNYSFVLDDEKYRMLEELAVKFSTSMKNFIRLMIHFVSKN